MANDTKLKELGFSQYETACYMALIGKHPVNGSQLSKLSGIARSRIYDVLRTMTKKGYVMEVGEGLYAPLPPDELIRRLKNRFESNIALLEKELEKASQDTVYEFIWTLTGYDTVIERSREMIKAAKKEIYIRVFPHTAQALENDLQAAAARGVGIRCISMGYTPITFDIQVIHPEPDCLTETIGGSSFDIIVDKKEALVGIFETGNEDASPINWTRNKWFITANRDSLRHDFYHYFLQKTYDDHQPLTDDEKRIYDFIKQDN